MKIIYSFIVIVLLISACKKDKIEDPIPINDPVIPPPNPLIDLTCNFDAIINGSAITWTQNVDGFYGYSNQSQVILPSPNFSSVIYLSGMASSNNLKKIEISLGSLYWDYSVNPKPILTQFNSFFQTNLTPIYTLDAINGFEFRYQDALGNVWKSKENSFNAQSVVFSGIEQGSDTTGDYSKFKCNFECYVYRYDTISTMWDSLQIQSAEMIGWFKR